MGDHLANGRCLSTGERIEGEFHLGFTLARSGDWIRLHRGGQLAHNAVVSGKCDLDNAGRGVDVAHLAQIVACLDQPSEHISGWQVKNQAVFGLCLSGSRRSRRRWFRRGRRGSSPLEPVVGLGDAGRHCRAAPHIGMSLADQPPVGPVDVGRLRPLLQSQRSQRPLPVHPRKRRGWDKTQLSARNSKMVG